MRRPTHFLTVFTREKTGVDDYDSPIFNEVEKLSREPIVFVPDASEYNIPEGGEKITQTPFIVARGDLRSKVTEGDKVELTPLYNGITLSFMIKGVKEIRGRTSRVKRCVIELK